MSYLRPYWENIKMMKKITSVYVGIFLILSACTPPPDPNPGLGRNFIATQLESFQVLGRNLKPSAVRVGGQAVNIVSTSPNGSSITVRPTVPLDIGEYDVEVTLESGENLTLRPGISVVDIQSEIPANDLGNPEYRDEDIIRGEAILHFDPSINQTELKKDIEAIGFSITREIDPIEPGAGGIAGDEVWQVNDTKDRSTTEALNALENELENFPDINLKISMLGGAPPSLESKPLPTNLEAQTIPARTQAIPADLTKARVAVLDTGVNAHKFFDFGNGVNFVDTAAARNFTSEADNLDNAIERGPDGKPPATTSAMNLGHGTAVTGVVLSTLSNALGVDNVRANADKFIVPVKVCEGKIGRCRALDVALGIYYAINQPNVKVINLSVGNRIGSSLILEALEAANKKGVTVVVSAGNRGDNGPSIFPAAYNSSNASGKVLEDLIGVGSVKESANAGSLERFPSVFSSAGPWVNLVANGEDIRSPSASSPDAQGLYSGTSFSAPQVSALAAMVHAKNVPTSVTPKDVKAFLLSKATAVPNCAATKCGQGAITPSSVLKPN
jgi:hypothetical protein